VSTPEEQLLELFAALDERDRHALTAFAQFLGARSRDGGRPEDQASQTVAREPQDLPEPKPIPRPAHESVVAAIKRLAASYHMLNRAKMLNETSALMSRHVLEGRDAKEVIDELERLFQDRYRDFLTSAQSGTTK
jgi:hypothetical protein